MRAQCADFFEEHVLLAQKVATWERRNRFSRYGFCVCCVAGKIFADLQWFWAASARRNSSFAPHVPRNRRRPSLRMRLSCAKSISTFFLRRKGHTPCDAQMVSGEEKIRIVLGGLKGEDSIAELCCREGIVQSISAFQADIVSCLTACAGNGIDEMSDDGWSSGSKDMRSGTDQISLAQHAKHMCKNARQIGSGGPVCYAGRAFRTPRSATVIPNPGEVDSFRLPSTGTSSPSKRSPKTGRIERPSALVATYSQSGAAV